MSLISSSLLALIILVTSCSSGSDFDGTLKPRSGETAALSEELNRLDSQQMTEIFQWHTKFDSSVIPGENGGSYEITPAKSGKAGLLISKEKYNAGRLKVAFNFQMTDPSNNHEGDTGADGICFAISPEDADTIVPQTGGGVGCKGIRGLAIEIDTYQNQEFDDPDGNHIAIIDTYTSEQPEHLYLATNLPPDINDGKARTMEIYIIDDTVTVKLDNTIIIDNFTIPNFEPLEGHLLFSGSTGVDYNRHLVWDIFSTEK